MTFLGLYFLSFPLNAHDILQYEKNLIAHLNAHDILQYGKNLIAHLNAHDILQ